MTVVMQKAAVNGASVGMPRTSMCLDIKSVEEIELHRSVGQHTEIGYDKLKRGWVEKFLSLTLSEDDSTSVIKRQGNEPS